MKDITIGTPVTTEQATRAVLRLIKSELIGNIEIDTSPGYTLHRIKAQDKDSLCIYDNLSKGEKRLVEIAYSIWSPAADYSKVNDYADISTLGGLDRTNRRKVIMILAYYYLGEVDFSDMDELSFQRTFC